MGQNQQNSEKEIAKTRIERMAELLLMSEKDIAEDCPLREILKKPFTERVLWLEDQSKFSLDRIIAQCEACSKCKLKEILSET
ncbi:MAG: hypothetical protein LBQ03_02810 [Puniceicoccales bacterium]|jgi:hypothetical protein|nr:hypothetical protein [Puniceicoccales bacterium]